MKPGIEQQARVEQLRVMFSRASVTAASWYAVLDAAQDATIHTRAADSGLRTQSLYKGELGGMLDHVAPHLTTFELNGDFAEDWFSAWGGHQGILIQTHAAFDDLYRHFREFLVVKDESGAKFRFRFYDPRILRGFLPVCNGDELKRFFGPVAAYFAESRSGGAISFLNTPRGLASKIL